MTADPRYMTIARPRSPHLSLLFTSLLVAVIWSVSVVVAVPTLLYSTTISYDDDNMETRRVLMVTRFALNHLQLLHSLISNGKICVDSRV